MSLLSTPISSKGPLAATIHIGAGCKLSLYEAKLVGESDAFDISLSDESKIQMLEAHQFLSAYINQRSPVYGINTHFGDQVNLLDPHISAEEMTLYYDSIYRRQKNLIKSHACGLGEIISHDIVRVAILLRAHCLAQGYSGVAPDTVQALLNFLNAGIVPVVYSLGSIGASGDLIPLSMIAAAIIGEEVEVFYRGEIMPAPRALELAGLEKFYPKDRDGLAMINGTSFMTAIASLALYDLNRAFKQMLRVIAMSLESMLVIDSAYHPVVHQLKGHSGEQLVNDYLRQCWEGSQLLSNLEELREQPKERPVQDYYSLRSVAQGFGPFQENLERAITWVENEMNSVNDNPIVDCHRKNIYHSANFMGYYVTDACDILKMNIAQASTWLHALLANMVHPRKNQGLPTNLVTQPDIQNGFRPLQLLAAAIAVQNRKLGQAHQAYMLPTEGDNQDVNSLGTHAALDLRQSVANLERLVAILLLASVQALEFRDINKASTQSQAIHHLVRERSKTLADCRPLSQEIEEIVTLLKSETI